MIRKVEKRKGNISRGKKRKQNRKEKNDPIFDATNFEVELVGSCNRKMNELKSILDANNAGAVKIKWEEASTPLFSYKMPELRGLIAVAMGCDVYKEGVRGWSASKINKIILQINKNLTCSNNEKMIYQELKKKVIESMKNADSNIVDTLVAAFLYEPAIIVNEDEEYNEILNEEISHPYIFDPPPTSLPKFLEAFAEDGNIIVENDGSDEVCKCPGFSGSGGSAHNFLAFEGKYSCSMCKHDFCHTCSFIPEKDIVMTKKSEKKVYYNDCSEIFCLGCFRSHCLGDHSNKNNGTLGSNSGDVSLQEMQRILNVKYGLQLDPAADFSETLDIYETYISLPDNRSRDTIHLNLVEKKVKFPILPSNALDDGVNNNGEQFIERFGGMINFTEGGRFISDKSAISDDDLPEAIILIASFVTNDPKKVAHKSNSDVGVYGHLPTSILNFAYHSRVDSGFRLLDRCAQHACDPKLHLCMKRQPVFLNIIKVKERRKVSYFK